MANGSLSFPDPLKTGAVPPLAKPAAAKPTPQQAPKAEPQLELDRVELSPAAHELAGMRARLQEIPELRLAVVEEVRQKLADITNTAALNAKLAEKLLTEN